MRYPDQSRIYYDWDYYDWENTKGNEPPVETFHTPRTQPIVPVVSTKRKRAMGDSNDPSIRRKLIFRDESGEDTSLEGALEIPSSAGSPALSPIMTERAPEEISKIPNLEGYRDTLDVSGFLPLGQTAESGKSHKLLLPRRHRPLRSAELLYFQG